MKLNDTPAGDLNNEMSLEEEIFKDYPHEYYCYKIITLKTLGRVLFQPRGLMMCNIRNLLILDYLFVFNKFESLLLGFLI